MHPLSKESFLFRAHDFLPARSQSTNISFLLSALVSHDNRAPQPAKSVGFAYLIGGLLPHTRGGGRKNGCQKGDSTSLRLKSQDNTVSKSPVNYCPFAALPLRPLLIGPALSHHARGARHGCMRCCVQTGSNASVPRSYSKVQKTALGSRTSYNLVVHLPLDPLTWLPRHSSDRFTVDMGNGVTAPSPTAVYACGIVFPVVCAIVVGIRFQSKRTSKSQFVIDDWLTIPALVC